MGDDPTALYPQIPELDHATLEQFAGDAGAIMGEVSNDTLVQISLILEEIRDGQRSMITKLERIANAVERGNPGSPQMRTVAPQPTVVPSTGGSQVPWQLPSQSATIPSGPLSDGVCPVHQVPWKLVPAGTIRNGQRAGQTYNAFWACQDRDCKNRPPQGWIP